MGPPELEGNQVIKLESGRRLSPVSVGPHQLFLQGIRVAGGGRIVDVQPDLQMVWFRVIW